MALNSRMFDCRVMHQRHHPRKHRFVYGILMFYLDLDELASGELNTVSRWFSTKPGRFYHFNERDYLPIGNVPLKERVRAFLAKQNIALAGGKVMLLTNVRTLGYIFNPVSFYFCADESGHPLGIIAEVGNTFEEKKAFFIPPGVDDPTKRFMLETTKHFYVSPFSELDLDFAFDLRWPTDKLALKIDDWQAETCILGSTLTGHTRPFDAKSLAELTFKYPLVTLKVIGLIHFEALRLFLKRVPFFMKEANPHLQQKVLNPHPSLRAHSASLDQTPYIKETTL